MRGRPAKVFSHGASLSELFTYTSAYVVEIFANAVKSPKNFWLQMFCSKTIFEHELDNSKHF